MKTVLLLCALVAGSSNLWATGTTTQVTSATATDGKSYVIAIYYDGDYYALPKASTMTSASTFSGTKVTLNAIGKVNTSDATDITWTIAENSTTSGQFYITQTIDKVTYYLYKNGTSSSSNYNIKTVQTGEHYWTFAQQKDTYKTYTVKSERGSANLYLTNSGSTFRVDGLTNSGITLLEVGDVPSGPRTVTYGDTDESVTEASAGAGIDLADRDASAYSVFKTFEGWSETNLTVETTSATIIKTDETYHPVKDVTLYPVYSRTTAKSAMTPASVSISDYATANKWANATQYTSVTINDDISASCSSSGNNGKYYGDWRMYRSDNGTVTIEAADGYALTSVKFTFTVANSGALYYGDTKLTSGTAQTVTGQSAVFTVKNTNDKTNGQVKITAIEVAYEKPATSYYTSLPVDDETKNVTTFGWATYIPAHAVQFSTGCAYVVTDASTNIEVAEVTKVPAGTPVILKKATGGDVVATVINESPAAPATNLLSIGESTIPDGKDAWVLAKNGAGKAGFKQWTGDDSALEGRVVLLLDEAEASRGFIDFDENDVTGISVSLTNSEKVNNAYYNLAGQRVAKPTKGLYIVNGKKVIIK